MLTKVRTASAQFNATKLRSLEQKATKITKNLDSIPQIRELLTPEFRRLASADWRLHSLDTVDRIARFKNPDAVWRISQTSSAELVKLGTRFPLPWSAYVRLLSVKTDAARMFYEAEALRGGWSVRQLDRQINSLFYERTALSKNKAKMLTNAAAAKCEDAITPEEEIKDPYVLEFLGLFRVKTYWRKLTCSLLVLLSRFFRRYQWSRWKSRTSKFQIRRVDSRRLPIHSMQRISP